MKKIIYFFVSLFLITTSVFAQLTVSIFPAGELICTGTSASLWSMASGGVAPYTYSWSTSATTQITSVAPTTTTTYTVTVTGSNFATATAQTVIIVNPNPTITSNSGTITQGNSINLCASGGNTYTWNLSGTSTCISVSPTITTTYYVTGTGNGIGCSNTSISIVTVTPGVTVTPSSVWTISGNNIYNNNSGNVGIGTNNPIEQLQVHGNIYIAGENEGLIVDNGPERIGFMKYPGREAGIWMIPNQKFEIGQVSGTLATPGTFTTNLYIAGSGNVGIGTTNPQQKFEVDGSISVYNPEFNGNTSLFFGREYASTGNNFGKWGIQYVKAGQLGTNSLPGLNFWIPYGPNNLLFIADNGNVLIGKNMQVNTTYKLDVAGKVRADEIVVNTNGADFVFANNYKLMSLSELEKNISKNKHLPGIPSADEMQNKGMSIGETNTLLLQKIEEITLYLIEQNKKMEQMQKEIDLLKKK